MFETICTVMGATLLFVAMCVVAAKAVIGPVAHAFQG